MLDACGHVFSFLAYPLYPCLVLDVILDFDALDLRFQGHGLITDEVACVAVVVVVVGDVVQGWVILWVHLEVVVIFPLDLLHPVPSFYWLNE